MPSEPLDKTRWDELVREVASQRIFGFLHKAIRDDAFPATDAQALEIRDHHLRAVAVTLVLEDALRRAAALLDEANIDFRVLKGPAHARLAYPDPSVRSFGDIDLLIGSGDFEAAGSALSGTGAQRRFPEPRPGFDRRFGKGACFVLPDGYELDLHRTLVSGPFGLTIDLPALFRNVSTFEIDGRALQALGPEERVIASCFHAVLGKAVPRLLSLRDLAQMLVNDAPDAGRVRHLAAAWRCEVVVSAAIVAAWSRFGLDEIPLSAWAAGFEPARSDLHRLSLYAGESRSYARLSIAAIRTVPGVRNKLSYVQAITVPQRLADDRTQLGRWRHGLQSFRRGPRWPPQGA